jgi:hypothetical protein
MKTWTAFYLLLFFIAASSASATETLDQERVPSSQFLVDGLLLAGSNPGLQLSYSSPSSSTTASAILEGLNTLAVSKNPGATDTSISEVGALTTGFGATELSSGDLGNKTKILLWLLSLAGLLTIVATARMIQHNKRVTDLVEANCKCSSCFSSKTLSSRWRWYELPLWLTTAQPSRCFSCQQRKFAWAWQRKRSSVGASQNLVPAR